MFPGGWEWLIIGLVALLLFGGTRLAGLGKNAGKAIREFKEELAGDEDTSAPTSEALTADAPSTSAEPPTTTPTKTGTTGESATDVPK